VANNAVFKLPLYAAGFAFPMDTLQTFLVSAYFNSEISRFAEQLLLPDPKYGSRLLCEPVPRRFHKRTYRDLWLEMLTLYDAVVIGIYRSKTAAGSLLPFVYLTPLPGAPLYSADDDEDQMYVLSRQPLFVGQNAKAPNELKGMEDVFEMATSDDVLASGSAEAVAAAERRRLKEAADREERRAKLALRLEKTPAAASAARAGASNAAAAAAAAASPAALVTQVADGAGGAGGPPAVQRAASLGSGPDGFGTPVTHLPGAIAAADGSEDSERRERRASQRDLTLAAAAVAAAEEAQPAAIGGSRRRLSGLDAVSAAAIASATTSAVAPGERRGSGGERRGSGGERRGSGGGGSKRRSSAFGLALVSEEQPGR
jgi:hypothetical protein